MCNIGCRRKGFCGTYLTIIGNMMENHDNPMSCVKSMLSDIEYEKRSDKLVNKKKLDRINTELKILMRNANTLHLHFNEYGKNEAVFVQECGHGKNE